LVVINSNSGMSKQKNTIVTPQKVLEIYKKHGNEISYKDAKTISEILYNFAKLTVYQEVNKR